MNYDYLLYLAIILLSTKLLGLATSKAHVPQVVGALLAGLILGPACLNLIQGTKFLSQVSEIGVIVLMFMAGLETDTEELKKSGLASFIIALIGVIVPLLGGLGIAYVCNVADANLPTSKLLQYIFIGIILTATSVSITVETLKELGKVSTKAGTAILGAALIDDILGIIALTLVTSLADPSTNIGLVLLKILGFFVFAIVFGVADITGAYVAGLVISYSSKREFIYREFDTVSYMLVAPVFFASIGLKVKLSSMTNNIIIFTVLLVIIAILTKIIGCGLGAKIMGYTNRQALQIGVGMISRVEVAFIVANKGESLGLIGDDLYAPVVVTVVITTIITPILLKIVFKEKNNAAATA